MATENPSLRLGDLLTSAGLLKPTDLREAMMIARQQQLPVGRVLIMNGYLSEGQLQSAVQAQSMIKDSIIDLDTAVEALDLVATEHISLDESLVRMGWTMNAQTITNKLGEFLVEAELVAAPDIHYALEQCREIGLPLGRVLVVTGYLTEEMLTNSLNAQVLVRDGRLNREQAVHGLRAALERQITLEESLQQTGIGHPSNGTRMRLGELLLGANLIDEASLMNAVEIGLVSEKLIGQVLLEKGNVSAESLDSALILQNMVAQGEIYAQDAIDALRKCVQNGISAIDALASLHEPAPAPVPLAEPLGLYQFLQLGGLITPQDVEQAMHTSARDTELMGKMLQFAGIMPGYMVEASKEALDLINRGALTIEQAMIVLKQCLSSGSSLHEAFRELNWEYHEDGAPAEEMPVAPQADYAPAQAFSPTGEYPPAQPPAPPSQAVAMPLQQSGQHQAYSQEMPSGAYRAAPQYATPGSTQNTTSGSYAPVQEHTQSGAYPAMPQPGQMAQPAPNFFADTAQAMPAEQPLPVPQQLPPPPVPMQPQQAPMAQPMTQQLAPLQPPVQPQPQQQLPPQHAPLAMPVQTPMPAQMAMPQPLPMPTPAPAPMSAPMSTPEPQPQQASSGSQQAVAPPAAPTAPQQSQWIQSQSGSLQSAANPTPAPAPADDTTLTAPPLPVPAITVPRVDQAINPWAAKAQAPAISPVTAAPQNPVQPAPQANPFAAPAPAPAPQQAAAPNPFTAPPAPPAPQAPASNPFAAPPAPAAPQASAPNPFATPAASQAPQAPGANPFAAPQAPQAPQANPFAAPPAAVAPPAPPAPPEAAPQAAAPAPVAPPAATDGAAPKRKRLNDLMPKSKK